MKPALCALRTLGVFGGLAALGLPALPVHAAPRDPDARHTRGSDAPPTAAAPTPAAASAATSASASARNIRVANGDSEDPEDPSLTARSTHYGDCSGNVSAAWYRSANLLTVDASATNSARFTDCKLKYTIRWHVGQYEVGSQSNDLPTACGTWDPTCRPSVGSTWVKRAAVAPVLAGQVDRISAEITTR